MPRNRTSHGDLSLIQGHGYLTGHVLTRQAWQQEAMAAAEQERLVREAGLVTVGMQPAEGFRRFTVGLGGALIRLGTRLQGRGAQITDPAR